MAKSPNYRIGALLRVSAMLAGILAWEITTDPIFIPEAALESGEVKSSVMIPNDTRLEKPAISTFSEFVSRPLFTPTRRPPPTKTEPNIARTAPKPENLQLIGVIISEDERMALLQTLTTGDVTRAVEGQTVGGWEVHAIKPAQVVLKRGNASEVVMINDAAPSSVKPPLSGQTNSSATGSPASAPPVSAVPE
jgi:type II secretory pathway component PulC